MITLDHVSKRFRHQGADRVVARDISFAFPPGERVGLLGRNGAGKSTMLKMLSGLIRPDSGRIHAAGLVSWPVGFAGSFHADLTGAQNIRFLARLYGLPVRDACKQARDISGLGDQIDWPLRQYSAGMKSRLAFAASMLVQFDTYLVDEITAVGDGAFRKRCEAILSERLKDRNAVIVSHSFEVIERLCTSAVVLEQGRFFYYRRPAKAIEHYRHLMAGRLPPWLH